MAGRRLSGDGVEYQPALDGLRAFAALAVVGYHLRISGFQGGYLGVDIFFVLSGFLITRTLVRSISLQGRVDFKTFYIRRALRLLPAYIAVVVAAVVADRFIHVGGTLKGAVASFLYVGNWAAGLHMGMGSLDHTWSLSIEEQFYLVWPALLAVIGAMAARRGHGVSRYVAAALLLTYVSTVVAVLAGASEALVHNGTPFRAIELLAGGLLATSLPRIRTLAPTAHRYYGPICLVGLVALVVLTSIHGPADPLFVWPLTAVLTCGLIAALCLGGGIARCFAVRPLVAIGMTSYGLYLWHFPVFVTVDTVWGLESAGPRLLALAITAALVPISYFLIEKPFLRLKSRFQPRPTSTPRESDIPRPPEKVLTPD